MRKILPRTEAEQGNWIKLPEPSGLQMDKGSKGSSSEGVQLEVIASRCVSRVRSDLVDEVPWPILVRGQIVKDFSRAIQLITAIASNERQKLSKRNNCEFITKLIAQHSGALKYFAFVGFTLDEDLMSFGTKIIFVVSHSLSQ